MLVVIYPCGHSYRVVAGSNRGDCPACGPEEDEDDDDDTSEWPAPDEPASPDVVGSPD